MFFFYDDGEQLQEREVVIAARYNIHSFSVRLMIQLFEQCFLGTSPLRMGNKCISEYFRLVVGPVSHLVVH